MHPNLTKAAMVRAKELDTLFSHTRPNGEDSSTALFEAGVGCAGGENIAAGSYTAERVVERWMNSPGHKAAILTSTYTHIGVGVYINQDGNIYWTQNFTNDDPDKKATITFDPMGGIGGYTLTVPWGQTVYLKDIPVPTKEGYTFGGWISCYNEKLNSFGAGGRDIFYAKWD